MSEARLLYNHVVDSLPNQHDRDTIRTYVDGLVRENNTLKLEQKQCLLCTAGHKEEVYELKQQNKQMLEVIISIQEGMLPYEDESGVIQISLHCWRDLKSIIESVTGKKIEEVLK